MILEIPKGELDQLKESIEEGMKQATTGYDEFNGLELDLARVEKLRSVDAPTYEDLTKSLLLRLIQIKRLRGWHFQSRKRALIRILEKGADHDRTGISSVD